VFVSIVAQLAWMDATVGTYDEGLVLVGADRVLRGEMPYRDFWTLYGPGSFYLLAGLFRVFGEFALVERGFDVAAKTAIATLVVALVLQFGRRTVALAAGVLSLGLPLYLRSYSAPLFPAMAASLATVLALHRASIDARPTPAFLAGVALAFTTCFRHDLGAYTLLAAGSFMIWLAWDASTGPRRRRVLATVGWVAAGYVICLGPVVAFFAFNVPAAELYRDFVETPLSVYPRVRALPFPSIVDALSSAMQSGSPAKLGPLVVYLPLVVMGGAVATELLARGSPRVTGRRCPLRLRGPRTPRQDLRRQPGVDLRCRGHRADALARPPSRHPDTRRRAGADDPRVERPAAGLCGARPQMGRHLGA
jgi:hypothetical protein